MKGRTEGAQAAKGNGRGIGGWDMEGKRRGPGWVGARPMQQSFQRLDVPQENVDTNL